MLTYFFPSLVMMIIQSKAESFQILEHAFSPLNCYGWKLDEYELLEFYGLLRCMSMTIGCWKNTELGESNCSATEWCVDVAASGVP